MTKEVKFRIGDIIYYMGKTNKWRYGVITAITNDRLWCYWDSNLKKLKHRQQHLCNHHITFMCKTECFLYKPMRVFYKGDYYI